MPPAPWGWVVSRHFAGITHWNPDDGLLANDHNVQAVYKLYGDLWSKDHNLQWAGMANLVGPMFYAGWQDLYATRNLADPAERDSYLLQLIGMKPPDLRGPLGSIEHAGRDLVEPLGLGSLGHLGSEEIGWYERRFLTMQKKIFDDLAWKHVAYSLGGIGLMRELRARGQLEPLDLSRSSRSQPGTQPRSRRVTRRCSTESSTTSSSAITERSPPATVRRVPPSPGS